MRGATRPVEWMEQLLVASQVPHVPFVDGEADGLRATRPAHHLIGDRRHLLDVAVKGDARGQEAAEVLLLLVVGVKRDLVHEFPGVREHGPLPLAEGGHRRPGASGHHELEVRVVLAHRACGLGSRPPVLRGRLVTELPGSVQLVAQAPAADAEGLRVTVVAASVGERRVGGVVGVFEQLERLGQAARSQVQGQHRLDAGALTQRMYSPRPKALVSRLCQARSSRTGRASTGPTPSSQR